VEPRVAYLFARYPVPSQTFCDSEILALEALGLSLEIQATSPPRSTFRHERLARLRAETCYLPPGRILRSHELRAKRWPPDGVAEHARRHPDHAVATRARHALALADALRRRGVAHVHAHFAGHAAHVAYLMKAISGISYSFTAHAQDFMVDLDSESLLGELCGEAEFVVAVSDWSRDLLRQTCPDSADRILRIYNGIDPSDFSEPAALGERERPHIVSIGRLIEFKGFHHLIAACAELDRRGVAFECTLVGEGPWRERLEAQVAEAGLQERVHFAGLLTLEEVKRTLREADVFALGSVVDQIGACDVLPTVILEAMATGLPVVSTTLAGVPEMVEDGVTGLLAPPGDAHRLADALAGMLGSRDLRRGMGEAGRKRVAEHFASAHTAPVLRERLLAAATRPGAPVPPAPPAVAWWIDQWPPRRSERLDREMRHLARTRPDLPILAGHLDERFEPTARGADLALATHVELLPDGIVLESGWLADPELRERVHELRAELPSFFGGEEFYQAARRAAHLIGLLRRRGIRSLHAARATGILVAWLAKRLDPGLCVSFALDRRSAGSRRAYARLCRSLDLGAVSDDLLFQTIRDECGDEIPLVTPIPAPPGGLPRLPPLRPIAGWLSPAKGPQLERGITLDGWLERLTGRTS
jgi:glycosyltransferase involved in cell wall biosynthesis